MIRRTRDIKPIFHKAVLTELQGDYRNPGRGWYHIYTFRPDRQDEDQLQWLPFEDSETLVLLRLDIGAFRERDMDAATLAFAERILQRFEDAGKDVILRVLYDVEGRGMLHEPPEFEQVCRHMQSLGALAAKHARAILLAQGMFIGSWGEMHDSRYLQPEQIRQLWEIWNRATDAQIPLAVRRPVYARMILPPGSPAERIGFYDDAIMADERHMGTFGVKTGREADWQEGWCASDEYAYIREHMNEVPVGGEVLEGTQLLDAKATVAQMKKLRITYLNSIYHPTVIEGWKSMIWAEKESLYQYIGNHMGYRFVVRNVQYSRNRMTITIENTGFAPLYEAVKVKLIAVDSDKNRSSISVAMDLRTVMPGTKKAFFVDNIDRLTRKGGYRLYLMAARMRDKRVIRFANEGAKDQLRIGRIEE